MGIVSDAVHIFFDSLAIIIGIISVVLPITNKIIRINRKIYLLDDILKLFKKHFTMFDAVYYGHPHLQGFN